MEEFKKLMNEPIKKPAYKREFYYDFKKYRAKRAFCGLQFVHILLRFVKEHWKNKARFLALLILPSLFIFLGWHFARYYFNRNVDSKVFSPDMYPSKNKVLVNEKTQVGGLDTRKWIEKLPMYEDEWDITYVNTDNDPDFYHFNDEV